MSNLISSNTTTHIAEGCPPVNERWPSDVHRNGAALLSVNLRIGRVEYSFACQATPQGNLNLLAHLEKMAEDVRGIIAEDVAAGQELMRETLAQAATADLEKSAVEAATEPRVQK